MRRLPGFAPNPVSSRSRIGPRSGTRRARAAFFRADARRLSNLFRNGRIRPKNAQESCIGSTPYCIATYRCAMQHGAPWRWSQEPCLGRASPWTPQTPLKMSPRLWCEGLKTIVALLVAFASRLRNKAGTTKPPRQTKRLRSEGRTAESSHCSRNQSRGPSLLGSKRR
jgi:hypothetical protein